MNIWKISLFCSACAVAQGFMAPTARADVLVPVTGPSGLGADDSVAWTQLGSAGTSVGNTFSATSAGGLAVGGSFASGGGQVCDSLGTACSNAVADYSIENLGAAPLTFTFPGVSGVGASILDDAAANTGMNFTASLALYNGTTLLGTTTATSPDGGPVYLGALDQTGADITSAAFSVASLYTPGNPGTPGTPGTPATKVTYSYNSNAGHVDPASCAFYNDPSLFVPTSKANISIIQYCPKTYIDFGGSFPFTVPVAIADLTQFPNVFITTNAVAGTSGTPPTPNVYDTDPGDLANFYVGGLDLSVHATTPTSPVTVPEPVTLLLSSAGVLLVCGLRRRAGTTAQEATRISA